MQESAQKYKRPSIRIRKIKTNFFSTRNGGRSSFDGEILLSSVLLASNHGGGGGCVLAGTKILLDTLKEINIEKIKPGAAILSYNPETRKVGKSVVEKLLIHIDNEKEYVVVNKTLKITPNHRLWVNHSKWKRVDELRIGDQTINEEGQVVPITNLELRADNHSKVYNLHLKNIPHTYFANGVLIHNGGGCSGCSPPIGEKS